MKRLLALALTLTVSVGTAFAQMPSPPEVAARGYLLIDITTGQTLAEREADVVADPASLTKLMTAYVTFTALREHKLTLEQTLPVSLRAWEERKGGGSLMFVEPRMKPKVSELLRGVIVNSGNDASVVLAEGVGGTVENFVKLMNEQAKVLGMKSTSYKNPEGLTEAGHTTTARDLSILATRLMWDFPEYVGFYSIKKYRYTGTPAANDTNRNLLLFRDPTVDGLKTGHTEAAGYCMVATAKRNYANLVTPGAPAGSEAANGSRRLLSIVLGATSENARANESQKLLNWGYTAFEAVKLFDAGQVVASPNIWKGSSSTVKLGQLQAIVVAVPSGTAGKLKTQVLRSDPLVAPVAKGQPMATLRVLVGDQPVVDTTLVAIEAVESAGVAGRAWDAMRLWVR